MVTLFLSPLAIINLAFLTQELVFKGHDTLLSVFRLIAELNQPKTKLSITLISLYLLKTVLRMDLLL